jgi:peptide chain release factor 2
LNYYAIQKNPKGGIADAISLAREFAHDEPILVLLGDNIFIHDLKSSLERYESHGNAGAMVYGVHKDTESRQYGVIEVDKQSDDIAGIRSVTLEFEGEFAYGYLKSEHGTHRLVRISPFDAEKMRHTSFAGIEVIPEIDTNDAVQIDPKDLRIDTFMSGGKGGQSVNTTYSAVRIVHIPTGITVQCQNERSQLQNREVALRVLQSKLQTLQEEKEEKERLELRGEYKSAEWGNQIRSYVLQPYKLVKDVRTKFESTDPDAVLNGEIDQFVEAYLRWVKGQK